MRWIYRQEGGRKAWAHPLDEGVVPAGEEVEEEVEEAASGKIVGEEVAIIEVVVAVQICSS